MPATPPAVNRPVLVIRPPPFATDQTGAMATGFPPASVPVATNCCDVLAAMVTGFGVTVMFANGPLVTVTVAKPTIAPLVALIVLRYVPTTAPAVKRPVLLMPPPPFATDQTGDMTTTFPFASFPVATNCW